MAQPEKIFVTTSAVNTPARPWATANYLRMIRASQRYAGRDFQLADRPDNADFILFVDSREPYLGDVYSSSLFAQFRKQCFVFNSNDNAVPVLPGLYPNVLSPARRPESQLGAFYLRCFDNQALLERRLEYDPKWLFSFVGNVVNARQVRERIVRLQHPRALLLDRSSGSRDDDMDYIQTLRDSQFVVCPKGLGPTSWRFYETMMAARVPIIVSDRWLAAREIQWKDFAIQVPESEIESIPEICERYAGRSREMGLAAREEWERHCSLSTAFGWVGRRLREIREATRGTVGNQATEFVRDLVFRSEVPRYLRWKAGQVLRDLGLREG